MRLKNCFAIQNKKDYKPIMEKKEFLNKPVQDLFKQYGVDHFLTQNDIKAAMVERINRTLKSRMYHLYRLRGDH